MQETNGHILFLNYFIENVIWGTAVRAPSFPVTFNEKKRVTHV